MIKKIALISCLAILLISCGTAKKASRATSTKKTTYSHASIADKVVHTAVGYTGTRYKYGGVSKSGMDCSGLIYTAFKKHNIMLPRTSRVMATKGVKTSVARAKKGDLIFFKTSKNRNKINHVGLVVSNKQGNIKFVHASSSKGVMTSSLLERYWKKAFAQIRNIL